MKKGTVAVVGLGYVGLPLAVLAAQKGWEVIGIDISADKVAKIAAKVSPIEDEQLQAQLKEVSLQTTTSFAEIKRADVVIVAVPTPVTEDYHPDLNPLKNALTAIKPYLQAGQIVSIESTINPGVMNEVVVPILGEMSKKVHLVHCPERINPGDTKWTLPKIPRVIGGITPAATVAAKEFYDSILEAEVFPLSSATEAEAVKILENTFRDINIAFINEMAKSFDKLGIDITNVIAGAATKPFAFLPHYPGNGVGGHCISVDPYYMIERARQAGFDHHFLQLARDINNSMPSHTRERLKAGAAAAGLDLTKTKITLLGVAYKKNIEDVRESPSLILRDILKKEDNIDLTVFDPYVLAESTVKTLPDALAEKPIVILGTDHTEFVEKLKPDHLANQGIKLVIDGKNALDGPALAQAGIHYYGIGRHYQP